MFLALLTLTLVTVYLFVRHIYSYWERKGFPNLKPSIPFGHLSDVVRARSSFGLNIYNVYKMTTEPFVGIYLMFQPALLVRDVNIVKKVLATDFNSFHDRGVYCNEKSDPLSANLFALPGQKWKSLRAKLTPAFTSGKLKNMFTTISSVGDELQTVLEECIEKNEIVEMKELNARFATDIIASVVFGLEGNCLKDPHNEFRAITHKINGGNALGKLKAMATFMCPKLLEYTGISSLNDDIQSFMIKIVKTTIEHRESNKVSRKDLMQLLLQIRNTGKTNQDGAWDVETVAENLKSMSIEQCAAQVFLFHIAGTESSSATITFCLHELTQNPSLLVKLQKDIDDTLAKYDGEITYESIQEMKYLDLCVNETIRKYPVLPILNRQCTEPYNIPGTDFVIEKGTLIVISLWGLHRDPQYFPDPDAFIPERFLEENRNFNPDAFIPFGEGPRACIALRLGRMIVKVGLAKLLSKYTFECLNHDELVYETHGVPVAVKNGISMKVTKR